MVQLLHVNSCHLTEGDFDELIDSHVSNGAFSWWCLHRGSLNDGEIGVIIELNTSQLSELKHWFDEDPRFSSSLFDLLSMALRQKAGFVLITSTGKEIPTLNRFHHRYANN